MKLIRLFSLLFAVLLIAGTTGCTDVSVNPKSQVSAEDVFSEDGSYKSYLARLYGGLNVTGQEGPAGDPDISAISDEGFSQYMRLYWQMQELPTDGAVIAWNDGAVQELNTQTWSPSNGFTSGMYSRVFFQVSHANEFLRQSTEEQLDARNVSDEVRAKMPQWRAEARFLRALSYWHGLDLFGDIPLVTEDFPRGGQPPEQNTRAELFEFVEEELLAIADSDGSETLLPPRQAEYGRADRAAAWMVLAKLYQNAPVYIGENRSDRVVEFTSRIIDAGYSLEPNYQNLFLADNHTADGIIFAIPQDGDRTQHFGGTTFLSHAAVGGNMDPSTFGLDFGWAGLRTTKPTVELYDPADQRPVFANTPGGQFFTDGQTLEINTLTDFTNGYAVPKFQNVTSTGEPGKDAAFPDTDYPMFRLADAYLMYAEAVIRGGGGSTDRAVSLVNALRERAFGDDSGAITESDLTLDFILDERGRELLWEANRRIDLIRHEKFTGNEYVWPFKEGALQNADLVLYPLPESELLANPNLEQNPGY